MAARRAGLIVATLVAVWSAAGPAHGQVYVQDSPAAAELLRAAEDRVGKDELEEAARLVQQVLDEHGDKLLERKAENASNYAEAKRAAADVLLGDIKLLKLYRQLMEPLAARLLAQAGHDAVKLTAVVDRYGLTDSGLKAALQLAGLELESGEASAASIRLSRLQDHPALLIQRGLWQRLVAMAALITGDTVQLAQARKALAADAGPAAIKEVDRLAQSLTRPDEAPAMDPLRVLPEAQPPAPAPKPIWTVTAGGAEKFLLDVYKPEENTMEAGAATGQFLNTLPYLIGGTLYVNDGQSVSAIEPSAGKELWRQQIMEVSENFRRFRPYSLPYGVDLNCVAATPHRVVAVMGFGAMVTVYPYYRNDAESQLACLDAATGAPLWVVSPEDVSSDLKESFFYGRPVISQGRVYVTVRRRQRTQFQDAYVVAIEVSSGKMAWKRHLASTAMSDRQTAPALSHMLLQDGWIYVDSRLGTVAKLSAADGAVEWMSVAIVQEDVRPQTASKPWHISAPVLVEAGLVVFDDSSAVIRVVDPRTGAVLSTVAAEQWGNPELITSVGKDVLVLGGKTSLLDGKTLTARWSHEFEDPTRGRAAVTANGIYVPSGDKVTLLDPASGKVNTTLPVELPANLLVRDGQLIATGRSGVSSYSSWEVASRQLEARIKARPDDPRPLMALAWLAFKSQNEKSLLATLDNAVELATKAPRRDEAAADELFTQILAMAGDTEAASGALRMQLFDRLAAVTSGAEHEVTYHLALANYLETAGRFPDAIEHYQTILAEPNYRRRLFSHESGSRQAGLEAQRRLQVLLEKQGATLYAPYEAFAVKRLAELSQQADPAPLIELSEAYPLASITPKALQVAAERTAQQGRVREAVALLRRAAQFTRDVQAVGQIYGRQAELFEQAGQPQRARRVLRSMLALYPDAKPVRGGKPADVQQWLAALASQPQAGLNVRLDPPLSAAGHTLEGTLLQPAAQDTETTQTGDVLLRLRDRIELRKGSDLSTLWQRPVESEEVQLLSLDRTRAWLYFPMSQRVQMLDAADGSLKWEQSGLRQLLADVKGEDPANANANADPAALADGPRAFRVAAGQVLQLDGTNLRNTELMVGVSDAGVAVANHDGRVLMLNADGGKPRWQTATVLRRVNRMLVDSQYVIVCGTDEEEAPLIVIYDAQSGVLLHRLMNPKRQNVLWMGLTDEGLLVYVSTTQVEAFDLNRGRSMWISRPGVQLMGADATWVGPERLVVRSQDYDLLWINMADGQIVSRLPVRQSLPGQAAATFDASQWLLTGQKGLLATDINGKFLWRDAITDAGALLDVAISDRHVIVLAAGQEGSTDPKIRKLYLLDRRTGMITHQHTLEAPTLLDTLVVLDGKLLIGGLGMTSVLNDAQ